jgi:hypothetical protein
MLALVFDTLYFIVSIPFTLIGLIWTIATSVFWFIAIAVAISFFYRYPWTLQYIFSGLRYCIRYGPVKIWQKTCVVWRFVCLWQHVKEQDEKENALKKMQTNPHPTQPSGYMNETNRGHRLDYSDSDVSHLHHQYSEEYNEPTYGSIHRKRQYPQDPPIYQDTQHGIGSRQQQQDSQQTQPWEPLIISILGRNHPLAQQYIIPMYDAVHRAMSNHLDYPQNPYPHE